MRHFAVNDTVIIAETTTEGIVLAVGKHTLTVETVEGVEVVNRLNARKVEARAA